MCSTLGTVDLKITRIERLKLFASSRGLTDNPARLGELIGKKPNQVYNLLNGLSSFGEKVARSIEEASGLPKGWLDAEEEKPAALTPEVAQVADQIDRLPKSERDRVLLIVGHALNLAHKSVAENDSVGGPSQRKKTTDTAGTALHATRRKAG